MAIPSSISNYLERHGVKYSVVEPIRMRYQDFEELVKPTVAEFGIPSGDH